MLLLLWLLIHGILQNYCLLSAESLGCRHKTRRTCPGAATVPPLEVPSTAPAAAHGGRRHPDAADTTETGRAAANTTAAAANTTAASTTARGKHFFHPADCTPFVLQKHIKAEQQTPKRPLVKFTVPEQGGQITIQPTPVICDETDYDDNGEPKLKKQRRAVIVLKPQFVISTCIGNHCDSEPDE